MRWVGDIARMMQKSDSGKILVENPEEKKLLGRPRRKWNYSIKVDRRGIEWDGVDWIDLTQNNDYYKALVSTEMNLEFHEMFKYS
jgi:hypothetical protein